MSVSHGGARTGARVLIVDDDPLWRRSLHAMLSRDHDVRVADSGPEALDWLEQTDFDVVISDLSMPGMDGRDLHAIVHRRWPWLAARFLFVSGGWPEELASFVHQLGDRMLRKTNDATALAADLRQRLELVSLGRATS